MRHPSILGIILYGCAYLEVTNWSDSFFWTSRWMKGSLSHDESIRQVSGDQQADKGVIAWGWVVVGIGQGWRVEVRLPLRRVTPDLSCKYLRLQGESAILTVWASRPWHHVCHSNKRTWSNWRPHGLVGKTWSQHQITPLFPFINGNRSIASRLSSDCPEI